MFNQVNIIGHWNNIGLDDEAGEYEIYRDFDPDSLIIHCLAEQLKISVPKIGYALIDGQLALVQKIDNELEYWEDSVRFQTDLKMILNPKDFLLYEKLLSVVGRSSKIEDVRVKQGKKNELFYPAILRLKEEEMALEELQSIKDKVQPQVLEVLDQRFYILLNKTYLNKLRTYILFWKKQWNIEAEIPEWFNQLESEEN